MPTYDVREFSPDVHGDAYSALMDAVKTYSPTLWWDLGNHARLLLAMDVHCVAEELSELPLDDYDVVQAVQVFRQRLGGWKNLESYAKCLLV